MDSEFDKLLFEKLAPFISVMTENARVNYNEKLNSEQRAQLAIILQAALDTFDTNDEKYVSKRFNNNFQLRT